MVRASLVLPASLLVVWISVLGSTGSLMQGWRAAPKELSQRAFGAYLRPSTARGIRASADPRTSPTAWVGGDADGALAQAPVRPRPTARSVLNTLAPQQPRQRPGDCFDAGGSSGYSSRQRTAVHGMATRPTQLPAARGGGDILPPRPMSALLYRRGAARPPASEPHLAGARTAATSATGALAAQTRLPHAAPAPGCARDRAGGVDKTLASPPISPAHWLLDPTIDIPPSRVAHGAQYRKRALALRRASGLPTRTLVAPEELTASAILPEEPNGITSMIAISTVLVFATLAAF